MQKKKRKPGWFILYALVILMLAVFMFENKDGLPSWANELADYGIVFFVFAAMLLWVRLNAAALWQEELKNIRPEEFHFDEYPPRVSTSDWQDEIHDWVESKEATIR